ncbi:hypothetical protein BH23PLA1_BH23PLA1_29730 [soil metagenome]
MTQGPLRVVLFCHSILSDWNHGHAHFLRGVVTDLAERGHDVRVGRTTRALPVTPWRSPTSAPRRSGGMRNTGPAPDRRDRVTGVSRESAGRMNLIRIWMRRVRIA